MINFRDAREDDTAVMASLITDLGYPTNAAEMAQRFKNIVHKPDYKTILALTGDEIVGLAGCHLGQFYEKNIQYLRVLVFVVKHTARNQGIGKILLAECERWAIQQGISSIIINSGNRDERIIAHAFYKDQGYEVKSSGFVKELL